LPETIGQFIDKINKIFIIHPSLKGLTMAIPEKIYTNGIFMTLDATAPEVEAIAVKNGRVLAMGTSTEIESLADGQTEKVDMRGQFAMPGLIESHTHALWGACRDLFEVYVGYAASVAQLGHAIRERADSLPKGTWISGGPWRLDMRPELGMTPRAWLDRLAPDHPVAATDTSQHAMWCNSLALSLAGIGADTPDIPGGVIERDKNGEPTGFLAETACAAARRLSAWTEDQLTAAGRHFVHYFNSLGYTAFKEPMADEAALAAYAAAHDRGELTLHMAAHITAFSPITAHMVPIEEIDRLRDTYARDGIDLGFAKLFLDGVAPARTAAFLEPYTAAPGYDPETHDPDATLLLAPDVLNRTVTALDAAGYVVKMHAVGDNAARKALDAIEAARLANGSSGLRHEIAHSTFIADRDLPRLAELDAVAEVSPKLWAPNAGTAAQREVLGEARLSQVHRIRSMLDAGADVIFGTDWPASAPDANPWTGLAGMISRKHPTGQYPGSVAPDQAITIERALPLFTTNAARAMGRGGDIGQLSVGACADFIVLPGDVRQMTYTEIAAIEVRETFWKGQSVYQAEA
jgi:predicted amidohydrolase YtcJ